MFPVQIEEAVRALPGTGDEFEIVLSTDSGGLDVMTVRCEHADHEKAAAICAAGSRRKSARAARCGWRLRFWRLGHCRRPSSRRSG